VNIGPVARRVFILLYAALALFNAIMAFGLFDAQRPALGALCVLVSVLESATASLIWIAAPVRNRW